MSVRLAGISDVWTAVEAAMDRRAHPRLPADQLDWLEKARLKYGRLVSLIDLSSGGALFESEGPLAPGATALLELRVDHNQAVVPGRILRCHVSGLDAKRVRYRGALEFVRPLNLDGLQRVGDSARSTEWREVLVAFLNGRLLKGYTRGFHTEGPAIDLWPVPDAPDEQRRTIPLPLLRTILFFGVSPSCADAIEAAPALTRTLGRPLEVTFKDSHVLVGAAPDYQEGARGFLMFPLNVQYDMRVFVVSSAVRKVRFL